MKRSIITLCMVVALMMVAAPAHASAPGGSAVLPEGTLLPLYPYEGEEISVGVGDTCYGSAAWAGFTYGIVKNAPNFMAVGYQVTDPSGDVVLDVGLDDSDACWTRELWDPATCELIGELPPFNDHLGVKPYFMSWFTPTFVASEAGEYSVHTTLAQTRPAPDLMLVAWEEDGEMVVLNHPVVWKPVLIEVDWTITAQP